MRTKMMRGKNMDDKNLDEESSLLGVSGGRRQGQGRSRRHIQERRQMFRRRTRRNDAGEGR